MHSISQHNAVFNSVLYTIIYNATLPFSAFRELIADFSSFQLK